MIQEDQLNQEQYCENIKDRMNFFAFTAKQLEHWIENKSEADTCRNTMRQWYQNNNQESRKSFFKFFPVDLADRTNHKETYNDQCR